MGYEKDMEGRKDSGIKEKRGERKDQMKGEREKVGKVRE